MWTASLKIPRSAPPIRLTGNNYNLTIGGEAYILESNSTLTNYSSYKGLLDDLQIYSGVLSDAEVALLYANPGSTVPDVTGGLGEPVVHYDFDEGTALAADVSGNNNNMIYAGNFGGGGPVISSDAKAGAGSVSFDGGTCTTCCPFAGCIPAARARTTHPTCKRIIRPPSSSVLANRNRVIYSEDANIVSEPHSPGPRSPQSRAR